MDLDMYLRLKYQFLSYPINIWSILKIQHTERKNTSHLVFQTEMDQQYSNEEFHVSE